VLLQLSAELRSWNDPQARAWASVLRPLEAEAAARLKRWVPKLHYPIRIGEHESDGLSFGLIWDWAGVAGDKEMRSVLTDAARRFYVEDRRCPIDYEPLRRGLFVTLPAEADFMRRVLDAPAFGALAVGFLPGDSGEGGLDLAGAGGGDDRADPKLAHIDGLNLSRAWMLEGIASGLQAGDRRVPGAAAIAMRHREAALPAVTGEHYEGGHWLGTFAVYLTSGAGIGGTLDSRIAQSRPESRRLRRARPVQANGFSATSSISHSRMPPNSARPACHAAARNSKRFRDRFSHRRLYKLAAEQVFFQQAAKEQREPVTVNHRAPQRMEPSIVPHRDRARGSRRLPRTNAASGPGSNSQNRRWRTRFRRTGLRGSLRR